MTRSFLSDGRPIRARPPCFVRHQALKYQVRKYTEQIFVNLLVKTFAALKLATPTGEKLIKYLSGVETI